MATWAVLFVALSPFWAGLEPGDFDVGYEHAALRDYARPFRVQGEDRARPIELSIWYPARAREDAEPLPYRRYVEGSEREALVLRLGASGHSLSETDLERIISTPTGAFENASHMPGPFPLLVFGTGLTAPAYLNTVLAEYLASHGFVVVAIPSIPAREDVRPDFDALAVETQLRDMEFVIHWMHDYPETDIERLGLVAWGFGGVAQALLQMKNADVGAVVSLDGATGYAYGIGASANFSLLRAGARDGAFFPRDGFSRSDAPRGEAFRLLRHDASRTFDVPHGRRRGPRGARVAHRGRAPRRAPKRELTRCSQTLRAGVPLRGELFERHHERRQRRRGLLGRDSDATRLRRFDLVAAAVTTCLRPRSDRREREAGRRSRADRRIAARGGGWCGSR